MRPLNYTRAATCEAAVAAFAEAGPDARYIAGGTTLFDLMKLGVEQPAHLIDLTAVRGLDRIETDGSELRFGAMALMADVAATPEVRDNFPVLAESLLKAASQQLRNMATVGGNLLQRTRCAYFRAAPGIYPCNKRLPGSGCAAIGGIDRGQAVLGVSPACNAVAPGDWPVALVALDARVELFGPNGPRSIAVSDLYALPGDRPDQEFALQPGEMITALIVPKLSFGRSSTYHKVRDRQSFAFALASAAVVVEISSSVVRSARIALGGVGTIPWRAHAAERSLTGVGLTRERAVEAGRVAFAEARPGLHNGFKIPLGIEVVADAVMIAAERSRS